MENVSEEVSNILETAMEDHKMTDGELPNVIKDEGPEYKQPGMKKKKKKKRQIENCAENGMIALIVTSFYMSVILFP